MRFHRLLLAPACLLLTAAPASAGTAVFQVTAKGNQVTSWDYVKRLAPSCDYPEREDGIQTLKLKSTSYTKEQRLKIKTRGSRITSVSSPQLLLYAVADMKRNYRRLYTQQAACPGGGVYGGGDGPAKDAVGTARCTIDGAVSIDLVGKGRSMELTGSPYWAEAPLGSGERTLPAACSAKGQSDADIGITEGQGEWGGGLVPTDERVDVRRLAGLKKGRSMTISFGRKVSYPNAKNRAPGTPVTKGQTAMALNVKLKRIR